MHNDVNNKKIVNNKNEGENIMGCHSKGSRTYTTKGRNGTGGKAGGGAGKAEKQIPTKAKFIDKMNEAQLDIEIAKQESIIKSANRAMGNTPKSENIGAIPLGQLTRGKTQAQKDKIIQRSTSQAKKYTDAYEKKKSAERTLKNLQKAKKEVTGTGKTQRELREEKTKKAVSETQSTLKWKQTQKGGWSNGGYSSKVISAGEFKISGSSGMYTIWKNGKQYGTVDKLSTAKAIAERLHKKAK